MSGNGIAQKLVILHIPGPHPRGFLIHQVQGQTENCIPGLASGALCCSQQRLLLAELDCPPSGTGLVRVALSNAIHFLLWLVMQTLDTIVVVYLFVVGVGDGGG